MAVRIRVYPNNGLAGGAYGTNALTNRLYSNQLANERKTSALRLSYERALWTERLKGAQLQAQAQYATASPYAYGAAGYGGLAIPAAYGMAAGIPAGFGTVPGAGMGYGSYGTPGLVGGHGQTNITNQSAVGAATQSVTNSNVNHSNVVVRSSPPFAGYPAMGGYGGYPGYAQGFGGFGSGGLISGLLGALI